MRPAILLARSHLFSTAWDAARPGRLHQQFDIKRLCCRQPIPVILANEKSATFRCARKNLCRGRGGDAFVALKRDFRSGGSASRPLPLRVNRVVLTLRRSLPIFPDKQTFSPATGPSQAMRAGAALLFFRAASTRIGASGTSGAS
jgi:hypothetical protein